MPVLSLSTFLKAATLSPERKISLYKQYLIPGGGYDYYARLKEAIAKETYKGSSVTDAEDYLLAIKRKSEKDHSVFGLRSFNQMYLIDGMSFSKPTSAEIISPQKFLKISISPICFAEYKGKKDIVCMWNTKTPTLTPIIGMVGVNLIKRSLGVKFEGSLTTLADLRTGNKYTEDKNPIATNAIISSELAFADEFFSASQT